MPNVEGGDDAPVTPELSATPDAVRAVRSSAAPTARIPVTRVMAEPPVCTTRLLRPAIPQRPVPVSVRGDTTNNRCTNLSAFWRGRDGSEVV